MRVRAAAAAKRRSAAAVTQEKKALLSFPPSLQRELRQSWLLEDDEARLEALMESLSRGRKDPPAFRHLAAKEKADNKLAAMANSSARGGSGRGGLRQGGGVRPQSGRRPMTARPNRSSIVWN
jgi:hypothetical protein